jgi:ABC-2 type transport system permease protein
LLIGYLLPAENVPQVSSLVLLVCSFAGGLLVPVSQFSSHTLVTLAKFTPLYGINELVHYPLIDSNFKWYWLPNLAAWLAVFVLGAVWRLRRDTCRV